MLVRVIETQRSPEFPRMWERQPMGRGWSGRRGSNPRPHPWQGCALPTELLPHAANLSRRPVDADDLAGAEGQNRTDDTSIFSAVLYLLSYLGASKHVNNSSAQCQVECCTTEGIRPRSCIDSSAAIFQNTQPRSPSRYRLATRAFLKRYC